jgi:hypothetical protein
MGIKNVLKSIGTVAAAVGTGAAEGAIEQVTENPLQSAVDPQSIAAGAVTGAAEGVLKKLRKGKKK